MYVQEYHFLHHYNPITNQHLPRYSPVLSTESDYSLFNPTLPIFLSPSAPTANARIIQEKAVQNAAR